MNEDIKRGAKGTGNDRLITISNIKREKKKEALKKMEKEVSKRQVITFITAVPIIMVGKTFQTIISNVSFKQIKTNSKKYSNKKIPTEQIEKTSSKNEQIEVLTLIPEHQEIKTPNKILDNIIIHETINLNSQKTSKSKNKDTTSLNNKEEKNNIKSEEKEEKVLPKGNKKESTVIKESELPSKEIDPPKKEITSAKNKKILERYDEKLKDIRIDLKQLAFEYNMINKDSKNDHSKQEIDNLLQKLNIIIKKIEELKNKTKVNNSVYNDFYITYLVDKYIGSFNNKEFVEDIKDSQLYILISEKLDDLNKEKENLYQKIESDKLKVSLTKEKIDKIKEEFYDYNNFNNELLKFQRDQELVLKDIERKVSTCIKVEEQVEYKIKKATEQSEDLLKLLAVYAMIPGVRSSKALATTTISFMYFMKRLKRPKIEKRKYKVIKTTDYSKEIEKSIDKIEDIEILLTKTSKKLENIITDFEKTYKEYVDVIPEAKQLLNNLNITLDSIKEKEYEIKRIKDREKKNLIINSQKIKKYEKV